MGGFAERFACDPDWVFENKSFDTVTAFAIEAKERGEYRERYNYIWNKLKRDDSTGGNTDIEH